MEDSAREAGSGSRTTDQLNQAIHNLQELNKLKTIIIKKVSDNYP